MAQSRFATTGTTRPAIGVAALATLAAAGCGGGGGGAGGAISGLSVPGQMAVVTPSGGAGSTAVRAQDVSSFASGAAYYTDKQEIHVYDPSTQPIDTVNMILCLVKQTRHDALVNQGPYIAQVDMAACGNGSGDGERSTGESAGSATQLANWIVNSVRPRANGAQTVWCWVPQRDEGQDATILAKLRVVRGVTDVDPFGAFKLDFAQIDASHPTAASPHNFGVLRTVDAVPGHIGFQFFEQRGDVTAVPASNEHAEKVAATVVMTADQASGVARISFQHRENYQPQGDSGLLSEEYLVAFDPTHLLRQKDGGATLAFSRTSFHERVWRYQLYHCSGPDAGERVELNTGFPFRTQDGEFGWLGYYGVWMPGDATLANGDVVEKFDYQSGATASYTILKAPGRLIRFTRGTIDLAELGGVPFDYWEWDPQAGSTRYRVFRQNGAFEKVASFDFQQNGWVDLQSPVAIDTAALGGVSLWSQNLNGSCFYKDGDAFLTYFRQSFVNPGDALFAGGAKPKLYGYFQCLRSGISGAEAEAGDVFLADATDPQDPHEYYFDESTMTLALDEDDDGSSEGDCGLGLGESPSFGPYTWGMRSGPLVTDTSGLANVWDIVGVPEFFVWETGPNAWNQYVGALDADGAPVAFDPPLQFAYTHHQADDRNDDATYDGATFVLQYAGNGNLWGLPSGGVDLDGDSSPDRWYPLANLADGVMVGPTGTEYVVKAVEIEQSLALDNAYSGGLDLSSAATLVLPDGSEYVTPDHGAAPTVTDPPAVIAGELQGGG